MISDCFSLQITNNITTNRKKNYLATAGIVVICKLFSKVLATKIFDYKRVNPNNFMAFMAKHTQ